MKILKCLIKNLLSISKERYNIVIRILGFKITFKSKDNVLIYGKNNEVIISENNKKNKKLKIYIRGNNNKIYIEDDVSITSALNIEIGAIANNYCVNNYTITIGKSCSFEDVRMIVNSDNSKITLAEDGMYAKVLFRCGELHHLIFDAETGEYIDNGSDIKIGKHVWICDNATIMKKAQVADNCIVAFGSIITKSFTEKNCVIGGVPAVIKKRNIHWERNEDTLEKDSKYYKSYFSKRINSKLENYKNA